MGNCLCKSDKFEDLYNKLENQLLSHIQIFDSYDSDQRKNIISIKNNQNGLMKLNLINNAYFQLIQLKTKQQFRIYVQFTFQDKYEIREQQNNGQNKDNHHINKINKMKKEMEQKIIQQNKIPKIIFYYPRLHKQLNELFCKTLEQINQQFQGLRIQVSKLKEEIFFIKRSSSERIQNYHQGNNTTTNYFLYMQQNQNLQQQLKLKKSQLYSLQQQNQLLQKKLIDKQRQLANQKQLTRTKTQMTRIESIDHKTTSLSSFNSVNGRRISEISNIGRSNEEILQQKLKDKQALVTKLKLENDLIMEENKNLKFKTDKNQKSQKLIKAKDSQILTLNETIKQLNSNIKNLQSKLQNQKVLNSKLLDKLQQFQKQYSFDKQKQRFNIEDNDKLSKKYDDLLKKCKRIQENYNNSINESKKIAQQLTITSQKLKTLRLEHQQKELKLKQQAQNKYFKLQKQLKIQCQQKLSVFMQNINVQINNKTQKSLILLSLRIQNIQKKLQQIQKQAKKSQQKRDMPPSISQRNYNQYFNGLIFTQKQQKQLQWLVRTLQRQQHKRIKKTNLVYRMDLLNAVNFHLYADGKKDIVIIIKLDNGLIVGGYSSVPFKKNTNVQFEQGYLFSLSKQRIFYLKRDVDKDDQNPKPIEWNQYYIVWGNNELRIQPKQPILYSNFAARVGFYDAQGETVNVMLGKGNNLRQTEIVGYELYQVLWA